MAKDRELAHELGHDFLKMESSSVAVTVRFGRTKSGRLRQAAGGPRASLGSAVALRRGVMATGRNTRRTGAGAKVVDNALSGTGGAIALQRLQWWQGCAGGSAPLTGVCSVGADASLWQMTVKGSTDGAANGA